MQWVQYLKTKQNKQKTPEKLFKVSHQKQNIKIKNKKYGIYFKNRVFFKKEEVGHKKLRK